MVSPTTFLDVQCEGRFVVAVVAAAAIILTLTTTIIITASLLAFLYCRARKNVVVDVKNMSFPSATPLMRQELFEET